ncbi:hypothetical protein AB1Y20_008555 [Prymnesium parvum]|uniref:Uncharacterized protein n=1 Tax=Prymnesium parvum TaxID=97485 RepID=A0AB34IRV1_PRYPA
MPVERRDMLLTFVEQNILLDAMRARELPRICIHRTFQNIVINSPTAMAALYVHSQEVLQEQLDRAAAYHGHSRQLGVLHFACMRSGSNRGVEASYHLLTKDCRVLRDAVLIPAGHDINGECTFALGGMRLECDTLLLVLNLLNARDRSSMLQVCSSIRKAWNAYQNLRSAELYFGVELRETTFRAS